MFRINQNQRAVFDRSAGQMTQTRELMVRMLEHSGKLRTYVTRHFPSDLLRQMDPEDVLQDIFFEAFRRAHELSFDEGGSIYRWLVTVARHRMCSLLRCHRTAKRGSGKPASGGSLVTAGNEPVTLLLQDLALYERTPSQSAMAHELVASLQQSIERLNDVHRQAIRLRYMDGMAVREIALRMNRTEGAVEMVCNRALKQLRRDLRSSSDDGACLAAGVKRT